MGIRRICGRAVVDLVDWFLSFRVVGSFSGVWVLVRYFAEV